jgi:conjugal transfer pilus assembly protein TraL
MESKKELFLVPKTLDNQVRVLGLPLDEFIPAAISAAVFFVLGKVLLSIVLPVAIVIVVKILKQGQGSSWLINLCYWYLPKIMINAILRHTPASENRTYIA